MLKLDSVLSSKEKILNKIFILLITPLVFFVANAVGNQLEVKVINETGKDLGVGSISIYAKNGPRRGCRLPNESQKPAMNKTFVPTENLTTRTYRCESANVKKWQRKITITGLCNYRNLVYLDDSYRVDYPRKKEWYGREQFKDTGTGVMYTVRVRASDCPAGSLN